MVVGALAEAAERVRAVPRPLVEVGRRLRGLPRGSWGMTLAHLGLGVFAMGAAFETAWRAEAAEALTLGQSMHVAGFELRLEQVGDVDGPNYEAKRAMIRVTDPAGAPGLRGRAGAAALCGRRPDHLARGDLPAGPGRRLCGVRRRPARPTGASTFLVQAYWNPWVRLIFLGPVIMALGGFLSLSDRRLRFAVPGRASSGRGLDPQPAE